MSDLGKQRLRSLEEVDASALPAKVLVLLSRYAQALRNCNGLIIKLSSLEIFQYVESTSRMAGNPELQQAYHNLLKEVNLHIEQGTMYTRAQREAKEKNYKHTTPMHLVMERTREVTRHQRNKVDEPSGLT